MCASQQLTTKSLLIQLSHETLFLYFLQFHRILLYSKATIFPNICIYVFGLEYKISLSNCFKQMCPSVFVAVLFHYCVHIPPAFPYCPFVFGGKCRCFFLFVFFLSPYVFEYAFAFLFVHVHIVLEFEYFDSSVHKDDTVLSWNICLSLVRDSTSKFS